ncbi:hypothetical protein ASA1KI_45980 [Opitutales bacterium ASA1]|uniref:glycosyltransferase family 4 protein n=1 Tax=Congregicoccus parvus TaxID=3081749 RepID=UPI002B30624E|nr:hypothetical protein ASA1KI_45980 [Opitutales bacterium ASA1]
MSTEQERPILVHPMWSRLRTGMETAAEGLNQLLVPELAERSAGLERIVGWINEHAPLRMLRLVLRVALMQVVPLCFPSRRLLFSSHHGPLWRTSRHAVVVYDLIALRHGGQSWAQRVYYRRLLPRVLRSASLVIAISESVAVDVKRLLGDAGSSDVTIEVVPAYSRRLERAVVKVDTETLKERAARAEFLFLGARYEHKNLGLVLRAWRDWGLARAEVRRPRLTIVGCRRDLWPELDDLEREGDVSVAGETSEGDVDLLLERCSGLLYPTRDEGQGLPPLEAMVAGCPVLCADIPVLRDTCGAAAVYIDPEDANSLREEVASIVSGTSLGRHLAAAGRREEVLARFKPEALRRRWREVLERWT